MSSPIGARNKTPRVSTIALQVAAILSMSTMHAVIAQEAKPADKPEAGKLETITVTAERRAENIKDVPSSISAVKGEKLDVLNSGGQDVRMLAGRVPSLNIESSFGRAFPRFYIRGLGNGDFDINASQPVSLVYDDVVQESPLLKGFPLFDLAGVEVLRAATSGASSLTVGANAQTGGIRTIIGGDSNDTLNST
jgi:iron complex outermembrane receptor protein